MLKEVNSNGFTARQIIFAVNELKTLQYNATVYIKIRVMLTFRNDSLGITPFFMYTGMLLRLEPRELIKGNLVMLLIF